MGKNIGVTFDKDIRDRAKADQKAMVCLCVDATFMPEGTKWANISLKGPMSRERAERARKLMFEFMGMEEDAADEAAKE